MKIEKNPFQKTPFQRRMINLKRMKRVKKILKIKSRKPTKL